MQVEELPQHGDVGQFEVVFRKLALVLKTHLAIADAGRPLDVVDAVDILQECDDALEAIGELGGDEVEIESTALLEVGELRDFHAVEHDLPADAPGTQRWRFPVVFFELDVVLGEVYADGLKAAEILVDDVGWRWLQDHLKLLVLVEAIGIFAVTTVGG